MPVPGARGRRSRARRAPRRAASLPHDAEAARRGCLRCRPKATSETGDNSADPRPACVASRPRPARVASVGRRRRRFPQAGRRPSVARSAQPASRGRCRRRSKAREPRRIGRCRFAPDAAKRASPRRRKRRASRKTTLGRARGDRYTVSASGARRWNGRRQTSRCPSLVDSAAPNPSRLRLRRKPPIVAHRGKPDGLLEGSVRDARGRNVDGGLPPNYACGRRRKPSREPNTARRSIHRRSRRSCARPRVRRCPHRSGRQTLRASLA